MSFLCLVTIPADSSSIEAALAAIRAGGVGLLDLEHCRADDPIVQRNLAELARHGQKSWGARGRREQLDSELPWAIVVDPTTPTGNWLALVREPEQLQSLDGWAGVVVSGSENGGRVGSFSSLPLLDAALTRGKAPVYLHGAAGVRAAAGARAIGAAGVVLDDQILLMPESPMPNRWRRLLDTPAGQETKLVEGQRYLVHPAWPRSLETPVEPGWGDPKHTVWPLGQGIALAPALARRYRTVQALVRAMTELSSSPTPLDEHSPLARSHGTRFPLVQGPMTRVSDRPEFARQVAEAGALPMMALALMSAEDTARTLQETRQALGELPWGVGILGFVPLEVRQAQLGEILKTRPRFALIAGGRPDQAHALEAEGIATYLHCPVPSLLKAFVAQGCRRFVFEGRECGGHTGPLGSLTLWEQMIEVLLDAPAPYEDYHLLFAGGLHDARTAALATTMAAPLTERGMRFGLLAGTAYLFTREAVETGAIVEEYQRQALACRRTVGLESAPGQSNRVAETPFARAFEAERQRLKAEGATLEDTQRELEGLGLGRLRVAARGLERQGERLQPVPPERQQEEGMYLLGEVGALRDQTQTLEELHRSLTHESRAYLTPAPEPEAHQARPCEVAIVGMSCHLPGASNLEELWQLCNSGRHVLGEVPSDRWDFRLFFDPDKSAPDKTYSKWGGFFEELVFDPVEFGIPPTSMPNINPAQLLALEMARRALADAGLDRRPFDREATAVVVASSDTGGLLGNLLTARTVLPMVTGQADPAMLARIPKVNEETFTGTINNIVSGRVANRLDLGGPNYTVDAACASSLTALEAGVRELVNHRSNVALVGAVDIGMTPQAYQSFAKLTALSPTGRSRPFDAQADGIVLSEGAVFVVLKRREDAERDGDRIYALIQSVGASSDGKALGMTAPLPAGQLRALHRAYRQAGVSPAALGLYEAHGTGTPVGDRAEAETVTSLLRADGAAPRSVRLGSVKAVMGHTKVAAGLVSLAKVALALHHETLPPHPVEQPLEALQDPASPLALDGRPAPWLSEETRRAGVSSFGFGGTNAHAVLEQYPGHRPAPGGEAWPWELLVFTGPDLLEEVRELAAVIGRGARPRLRDIAYTLALKADPEAERRLLVVIDQLMTLEPVLRLVDRHLTQGEPLPPEALLIEGRPAGKVAFLFSGQGSQAVGACREPALYLSELREALKLAQREVGRHYPRPLASYLYPGQPLNLEEELSQRRALTHTHVAQPVLGALSLGLNAFLKRLGVQSQALAGHSFGELSALAAAGAMSQEDFLRLAEVRGRAMAGCAEGTMAAILAAREEVERHLADGAVVANHNAPEQTVISGTLEAVQATVERLRQAGHSATMLEVAGAFHSPLMESAQKPLSDFIATLELAPPALPVVANRDGLGYPPDPEAVRARMQSHLLERVEFVAQIRSLLEQGVDTFVELGPGSVLTRLVEKIAPEASAIALGETDLRSFLTRLARLAGRVPLDVAALFEGRSLEVLDFPKLEGPPPLSPTAWLVNGNQVRKPGDPLQQYAEQPLLDSASAALEARRPAPAPTPALPVAAPSGDLGDRLAAFQAYQQTMQVFLKSQEEVMRALLGSAPSSRPTAPLIPLPRAAAAVPRPPAEPPAPKAAPPPKVESAPEPLVLTEESLLAKLVALVSERTGYPPAMLGADLDIEAQLGVDSIKRLEILDRFMTTLSDPRVLHGQLDRLSRTKTLRGLAQAVLQLVQPVARPCARYVMEAVPTARPAGEELPRGLCWITEDAVGAAEALVSRLGERAVSCLVLPSGLLADPARLAARVEDLVQEHGPPAMLVHLAPVGRSSDLQVELRSLFQVVRRIQGLKRILVVSGLDGHFGRKLPGSPFGPACQALLKCLLAEWPGLWARALDFEAELSSDSLAEQVVEELSSASGDLEVGLPRSGRLAFKPVKAAAAAGNGELPDGAVVLATGGARGISFQCLSGLVRAGMRLVLVGTTPLSGEEIPALPPEKLRTWLLERSQGETPAAVESRLNSLLCQREIREHLESLTRRGLTVDYRVCDVRDRHSFAALIDSVYEKYGRLDAVLHGAGIIRDKLVGDKTMESFDEVVATKVAAAEVLLESLRPESLRAVVLFSSTAGRFGNRGQGDYALANEVLNRLAYQMQARWPRARVVSVSWGPWAGAGMAGDEVNRAFRARGIEPISAEAGVAFLQAELRSAGRGEVEVVAGEGPWERLPGEVAREVQLRV